MFKYKIILEVTREGKMTELNCANYELKGNKALDQKEEGPIAILISGCGKIKIKDVLEGKD